MPTNASFNRHLATYLREQFDYLLQHEPIAREGIDPIGVHQMRVATRRIRSILSAAKFAYAPDATVPVRNALKVLARDLGAVRDLDVLLLNLTSHAADVTVLISMADENRQKAHRELLVYLESVDYHNLIDLINQFIDRPDVVPITIGEAFERLIPAHLEQVRQHGETIDPRSVTDDDLHRLRIECKRLRYLADLFVPIGGEPITHLAEEAAKIQSLLGQHQDACVEIDSIREFAGDHTELTRPAEQTRASARSNFPELWAIFLRATSELPDPQIAILQSQS